jgi:hypothetical protein
MEKTEDKQDQSNEMKYPHVQASPEDQLEIQIQDK